MKIMLISALPCVLGDFSFLILSVSLVLLDSGGYGWGVTGKAS